MQPYIEIYNPFTLSKGLSSEQLIQMIPIPSETAEWPPVA